MTTPLHDELLTRLLRRAFGALDPAELELLRSRLEWVELGAGETLMSQGEPGDSLYLSVAGRLRAAIRDADGVERPVREMARGEIIGEISLYTGGPRTATVVAIRDSLLVRLGKADFESLLSTSAGVSIALTRLIIERLRSARGLPTSAPVVIGLLPVSAGVDAREFARRFAAQLGRMGPVALVDADSLDSELQQPGLARAELGDAEANQRIALHLERLETLHDRVLLVGDGQATAWTERCSRHCDEVLLLADAQQPPELHETERRCLMPRSGRCGAAEILVLLHPAELRCPRGTREWLARRPMVDHVHVRPELERDMARLARIETHTAIGLVLAGGGARGIAHLGVFRALEEQGVEVDFVGGTSIGSIMAGFVAADRPAGEVLAVARRAFSGNPTGDYNLVPLLSLIRGGRLRRLLDSTMLEVLGQRIDIEDFWKNYYCVASNVTQAREEVLEHGELARAIQASVAIPGALPPVLLAGDLLCDGGSFDNFPVGVMRARRGVGLVIGVDLSSSGPRPVDASEVPGNLALLLDRLRSRSRRRYRFPSLLSYLADVSMLYSISRQRQSQRLTDLYFNPPLQGIGMLDWDAFDAIAARGHAHASATLASLSAEELAPFRALPSSAAAGPGSLPKGAAGGELAGDRRSEPVASFASSAGRPQP